MRLIDLTLPIPEIEKGNSTLDLEEMHISAGGYNYTGMIYNFHHWSMSGTYIDFPGHIKETDDGYSAENYPLEKLYEVETVVLHLDRSNELGLVTADELEAVCPDSTSAKGIIVNALGSKRFDEIAQRSVAFSKDSIEWIVSKGFHLMVSDIYESNDQPQNVFFDLFKGGVSTVCYPVNLHLIDSHVVKLTVLTPRFPKATQLPCRVVARLD